MNTTARCLLALAALLGGAPARADGYLSSPYTHRPTLTTVSWEPAFPLMSLRSEFIDAPSLFGLGLGFRREVGTRLSAGADVIWNRFEQSSTLGDQLRMDVISVRGTIHYYFTGSEIQPYAGLGIGGLYREAIVNTGPTQVGFGLVGGPELGILLTTGDGAAIDIAVRYQITTASFDVNGDPSWHVSLPSWLGAHVGLAFY